jgi:hypothetical protein
MCAADRAAVAGERCCRMEPADVPCLRSNSRENRWVIAPSVWQREDQILHRLVTRASCRTVTLA